MPHRTERLHSFRLLSIYGYEALGAGHNMHAMLEFDVTDVRKRLREARKNREEVSFFGFLLSAIAGALDENRELNHIRKGKKLYYFDEIDIDLPIELTQNGVTTPRKYVVRDAARKSMQQISREIREAKESWIAEGNAGEEDRWARRWLNMMAYLPKWSFKLATRVLARNPFFIKKHFGTTYVTSVSGFSTVSGHMVPYIAGQTRPMAFSIGNVVRKPGVTGNQIGIREYLHLTVSVNHDLVDGAPAARFVNCLKQKIENPVLSL